MVIRVKEESGEVLDEPRGLNEEFDEDEWEEAVRSFVEWIEEQCEYLDYYRDLFRDVEREDEDLQPATADRDDWEGTMPSDAGEAAFGSGPRTE
ncbi:hypothetical protein [Candidatus Halobonum tyrrellensis]|uniref:Uncharacterized protein n=1 Tax=Candidatus Halobonum tyrrellensis G22 TaxID=1324957 RepID=V4J0F5_9EURY|nr:hypothetical protein [Candidatus Halobonum tyrrellensis]ESP88927.1 hypothetical protein K933_06573 [Candidatus Halobonum tyrrellensis G22]